VQDKLPLTTNFNVPGNIGDGKRWDAIFESPIPLDTIGLDRSRLNFRMRWQDSSVDDPVTGVNRLLCDAGAFGTSPTIQNENKRAVELLY